MRRVCINCRKPFLLGSMEYREDPSMCRKCEAEAMEEITGDFRDNPRESQQEYFGIIKHK